ncbi:MAG: ATP-binding protein [Rickettsiales bacterium]
MHAVFQLWKRFLPRSLFGRALLILVIPTVLVQAVAIYMFYERHWDSIVRNMSASLAGEVALLVYQFDHTRVETHDTWTWLADTMLGITVRFSENPLDRAHDKDPRFEKFRFHLRKRLDYPFTIRQLPGDGNIIIRIQTHQGVLEAEVSKKRLVSSTTSIFVIGMVSSALVLLLVAILFMRNQIRPIARLAKAAEGFGMGVDDPLFRPSGASEVRQAARAFLTMKTRISRQIATRTDMLSGISHDLKTPLTRMKLQLAMLPPSDEVRALQRDVEDMRYMIQEYLDFARGDDGEESTATDMTDFLKAVVMPFQESGDPVTFETSASSVLPIKKRQLRRAFDNLITNAMRYGVECRISLEQTPRTLSIYVDDKGSGIPEDQMETVFQPFRRLEESRNEETGGVGLGLTIARDIIQSHGGEILLRNRRLEDGTIEGLRVIVRLPIPKS